MSEPQLTSTVTLTFGEASITINGPAGGQPVDPQPRYVTAVTESGKTYAYKRSTTSRRTWRLQFDFLTSEQKADLEAFYEAVDGPSATFSYTHTDGASYTARFVNITLQFTRVGPNQWAVPLQLETDGVVN